MVSIKIKDGEPAERALRRFKKKWEKAGILKDCKSKTFYLKPREQRKLAKAKVPLWKKKKTTGFLHANARPMKQTEDILVFSPLGASGGSVKANKNMKYNPQGLIEKKVKKKNNAKRLGKFLHQPEHMGAGNKLLHETEYEQKYTNYPSEIIEFGLDKDSVHPTQKPVALMEYLIRTYTNEGEVVLDNCMGSGTTGVACVNTNRQFIGIEMNDNYFKIAEERINNIKNNPLISAFN